MLNTGLAESQGKSIRMISCFSDINQTIPLPKHEKVKSLFKKNKEKRDEGK